MDIPEFDMRVLSNITNCKHGWLREELYQQYGSEISETIDFLLEQGMIKIHEQDLKPFLPPDAEYEDPPKGSIIATRAGKIEVKRWNTLRSLSTKERWKERIYGFVSGFLITVLSALILSLLSQ